MARRAWHIDRVQHGVCAPTASLDGVPNWTVWEKRHAAESTVGALVRMDELRMMSDHLSSHARSKFNVPGVTLGGRDDASPLIVSYGSGAPQDRPNVYLPDGAAGRRAPHNRVTGG
jgi:hypothetical protein